MNGHSGDARREATSASLKRVCNGDDNIIIGLKMGDNGRISMKLVNQGPRLILLVQGQFAGINITFTMTWERGRQLRWALGLRFGGEGEPSELGAP